ncbi:hypothetical protein DDI_2454 [Dickeya dianthicola RNS04.9]|nr:hypothetical protein DDI_2454 [Dickeya dianthicola RNS04.9]
MAQSINSNIIYHPPIVDVGGYKMTLKHQLVLTDWCFFII